MNQDLTPEQKEMLTTWVGQRDSLLKEISELRIQQESLVVSNKNLSESNTEIANKIQQSIGRLEELKKKEEERISLIDINISENLKKKSLLEVEISKLLSEISFLKDNKENLFNDIKNITSTHELIFNQTGNISRIINETVILNSENTRQIKNILVDAGNELEKITKFAEKNVEVTNKAILEIPKIIVDIHRDVIERRKISKHKSI